MCHLNILIDMSHLVSKIGHLDNLDLSHNLLCSIFHWHPYNNVVLESNFDDLGKILRIGQCLNNNILDYNYHHLNICHGMLDDQYGNTDWC